MWRDKSNDGITSLPPSTIFWTDKLFWCFNDLNLFLSWRYLPPECFGLLTLLYFLEWEHCYFVCLSILRSETPYSATLKHKIFKRKPTILLKEYIFFREVNGFRKYEIDLVNFTVEKNEIHWDSINCQVIHFRMTNLGPKSGSGVSDGALWTCALWT